MAAEAAASAAGMVAQSVMKELIIAREEAAQALRFLQGRGLTDQVAAFAKAMGPQAMMKLNEHMSANPNKYPDMPGGCSAGMGVGLCVTQYARGEQRSEFGMRCSVADHPGSFPSL